MSPKRKQGEDGDALRPDIRGKPRRKVTVLEMRDLEGEYLLVLARLQLIKVEADPTHATGNPRFLPFNSLPTFMENLVSQLHKNQIAIANLGRQGLTT